MSIYGAPFEDENLNKPLDRAGLLVMLNDGPNLSHITHFIIHRNLSRFLITSAPTPSLFNHCSLFGRVVRGLAVIRSAMSLSKDADGNTRSFQCLFIMCSEMVLIANTSVADDGPIPPEFTIPVRPSLRPNPMVPPACDSLMGTATIVGGSHAYTMQRDQPLMETTPAGIEGESEPAPPGADNVESDANAAQEAGYDYYSYVTTAKEGEIDWDYDETAPGVNKKPRTRTEQTPTESMPGSFISSSEY